MTPGSGGLVATLALVLAVAGCAAGTRGETAREMSTVSSTPSSTHGGDPASPASCRVPSLTPTDPASWVRGAEVRGSADRGTLWALLTDRRAGKKVKTIWRITGSGDFSVAAIGPGGQRLQPDWGPEPHEGSSWQRPGSEWGVGWTIPEPGHWTFEVHLTGGNSGAVEAEFC